MAVVFVCGYEGERAFGEGPKSEGGVVPHFFVQLVVHDEGTVGIVTDGGDDGVSALVNAVVHVTVELSTKF